MFSVWVVKILEVKIHHLCAKLLVQDEDGVFMSFALPRLSGIVVRNVLRRYQNNYYSHQQAGKKV